MVARFSQLPLSRYVPHTDGLPPGNLEVEDLKTMRAAFRCATRLGRPVYDAVLGSSPTGHGVVVCCSAAAPSQPQVTTSASLPSDLQRIFEPMDLLIRACLKVIRY
jgi:hypothetical protein